MSRCRRWAAAALLLVAAATSCSCAQVRPYSNPPCFYDIAFVADGAGNYQYASKYLRIAAANAHAPLAIETFVWSHGDRKVLIDQIDFPYTSEQGKILAQEVAAYHQANPHARVHLVGHSAGALVALVAAECLPPGVVENIVLLSPSISADYDLRPALRCVHSTVEVHYSRLDLFYLGLVTSVVGTADRQWDAAGGRVGFRLRIDAPEDACLASRLVQHPWQLGYIRQGNYGGHYGGYQPEYLQAHVLPVLLSDNH